jgi:predicted benzoate:H+ symporter BenE
MQAIAAVAISRHFSITETVSAGFFVSGVVLILSITGLLRWFTHVIPTPVVKGIQVGAGLSLVISAGTTLLQPLGWVTPSPADNLCWALFAFLALLATTGLRKVPYALVIFILGLFLMVWKAGPVAGPRLELWHPAVYVPSWASFKVGPRDPFVELY